MIKINCDLCGKSDEILNLAVIEEVELNVCQKCSKFGRVVRRVMTPSEKHFEKTRVVIKDEEKIEVLVGDYSAIIRKKRESLGLTQSEFAKKISEKESMVHKIEIGVVEPQLSLARKLENMLGVKLVEEVHEEHVDFKKKKPEGFTLGDFINVKNLK